MSKYQPKTKPFRHQQEEWEHSRDMPYRAILWEQGTGKTKLTLDTVGHQYLEGNVDGLLVVAPNGVHRNWLSDEIPTHLPEDILAQTLGHVYHSKRAGTKWHKQAVEDVINHKGLAVLCISYDAFMTKAGKEAVRDFLWKRKTFYVLDESSRVKNPSAKRTKSIVASGKYAPFRRILNGTPVSNGPFDVFSQVKFLDEHYWHQHELGSFLIFKQHFGIWKRVQLKELDSRGRPREFDKLVDYRRLEELSGLLAPIASRVTKEDVLDLPPKLYSKRYVELTPQQERLYEQLRKDFMAFLNSGEDCGPCGGSGWIEYEGVEAPCVDCDGTGKEQGGMVTAPLAITRLLRLQQVVCGYIPVETFEEGKQPELQDVPGGNPRIELLGEIAEDLSSPFIVFARFVRDIDLIMEKLESLGIPAVRYDGSTGPEERAEAIQAFQKDGTAKAFVANTAVAAEGLTLHAAKTVVYYSNDFMLAKRLQSEDRAHRIGQEHPVQYIDIVAPGTIDEHIVDALRKKFDVATRITGDKLKEWLHE